MNIIIQSPDIHISEQLKHKIERKLLRTCGVYDRTVKCEVILRQEKDGTPPCREVEVKVVVPGGVLFTKQTSASFEGAINKMGLAIKHQLEKHRERFEKS